MLEVFDGREGWTGEDYDPRCARKMKARDADAYYTCFELITGVHYSPETWLKGFGRPWINYKQLDEAAYRRLAGRPELKGAGRRRGAVGRDVLTAVRRELQGDRLVERSVAEHTGEHIASPRPSDRTALQVFLQLLRAGIEIEVAINQAELNTGVELPADLIEEMLPNPQKVARLRADLQSA